MVLVLSHYILFCHIWLSPSRSLFFSNETQKRNGSGREGRGGETGELKGVETVIKIWCLRKESIFNKRKKFKISLGSMRKNETSLTIEN